MSKAYEAGYNDARADALRELRYAMRDMAEQIIEETVRRSRAARRMRHRRIYQALKKLGFSAAKAAEVLLDAKRRDPHAWAFVKMARRHGEQLMIVVMPPISSKQ